MGFVAMMKRQHYVSPVVAFAESIHDSKLLAA